MTEPGRLPRPESFARPVFRIRRRRIGPVLVLTPVGELDAGTVTELVVRITADVDRFPSIVLDLSAVSFLECCVLGRLVASVQFASRRGVRLRTAAATDAVHRLFSIFDLHGSLGGRLDVAGECRLALQVLALSNLDRTRFADGRRPPERGQEPVAPRTG